MKLCGKCKTAFRKLNSSYCSPCTSEYHKKRYEAKKEKLLQYQHEYIKKNQDVIRAKNAIYKAINSEFCKKLTKKWKKTNAGKVNATNKKRRLRQQNATPHWLTDDDFWMIEQAYELAQLRTKMLGIKFHVDHILPIKGKTVCGLHVPNNLQVIPALENIRKGNRVF